MSFLFFFFQAEDGIRDHCVTGVQTCALPISSFEVFKSHMFVRPGSAPGRSDPRPEDGRRSAVDEEPPEPGTIDPRVKEIYRRLVRRLHPDLRADGDATVSSLWHEVQEAYAAGDVARMELLLALSDLSNALGV